MTLPTVSVGIPAYNEEHNIRAILTSLLSQKRKGYRLTHIYVVDDKSTDTTVREILSVRSKLITLIRNRKRLGQALSQNKLLKVNTSDILVLMNADILPLSDTFIAEIVRTSRRAPRRWAIIGTRTIPYPGGTFFEKIMAYAYALRMDAARSHRKGNNIYTAIGAARGISKEFAQVFRFPNLQTEDVYMYMWARAQGYGYTYCPRALSYIKMPSTLSDHLKQSRRYVSSREEMSSYFTENFVRTAYTLPPRLLLPLIVREIVHHPFYFAAYIFIILYSRIRPMSAEPQTRWETVTTSKSFASPTILIPDATGPANIGDQAILAPLMNLIREVFPERRIIIHSNFPERYVKQAGDSIDHTLYSYAVYENPRLVPRILRTLDLLGHYAARKIGFDHPFGNKKIRSLLSDYDRASLIFFPGGGYLRSRTGITQILNTFMHTLMIDLAVLTGKPTIIAPISFGPFGYEWLSRYTARILSRCALVSVREHTSYDRLAAYGLTNVILSTDHALLLPYRKDIKKKKRVVGFTIRHWMEGEAEDHFEHAYVQSLIALARQHKLLIQPIIQVYAPGYGREQDDDITRRIVSGLKRANVKVLPTLQPASLEEALHAYGSLETILGMRMHSSIIAATQHVPYAAIAYEHKTQGIADAMNYGDHVIRVENVQTDNLSLLLENTYTRRNRHSRTLAASVKKLSTRERKRWTNILSSLAQGSQDGMEGAYA